MKSNSPNWIIELLNVPFRKVFFWAGIAFLFIGMGFDVKGTIETSEVKNLAALVTGIIFIVLAVAYDILNEFLNILEKCIAKKTSSLDKPSISDRTIHEGEEKKKKRFMISGDPFFSYYIISAVSIIGVFWVIVANTVGEIQHKAVRYEFVLIAGLIIVLLIWRYLSVCMYLRNRDSTPPIGFMEPLPSFIPYFFLIGTAIIALVALTFIYTETVTDSSQNRLLILKDLIILLFYLAFCRLVWEIIDRYHSFKSN